MIIKDDKKEVIVKQDNYLTELKNTQEMCALLLKTPHYAKMGPEGIFAIVETAKSLNIDPRQALGGGLYYVKGRVEMQSRMMAALIRSKKHSITRSKESNDEICILNGKRADTKDQWKESFSIDEANKAGLTKRKFNKYTQTETDGPWQLYPRDMLYARALSRLARQLFPDIIGNCYVKGEIGDDPNIEDPDEKGKIAYQNDDHYDSPTVEANMTGKQLIDLDIAFEKVPAYRKEIEEFLEKKGIQSIQNMPLEMYNKVLQRAKEKAVGVTNENN